MKITIIGGGHIGGATAIGLAKHTDADITVTAAHRESLEKFRGMTAIHTTTDNVSAAADSDIIIIAVKPWIVENVIIEIRAVIDPARHTVVSMAPGIRPDELQKMLPDRTPLAYIIPNTAIETGESMTFITPVTTDDRQTGDLETLFKSVGQVMTVDEKHLGAGTALASCGIAYALRYIRAAAEGGVELGFKADDAAQIVAQTVIGAARLLQSHGSHPESEIDRVTTPGGLTIRGLNAMEEHGFTNAVIKGLTVNSKK